MIRCAVCGQENPDVARFCLNCGSPLAPAAAGGEERRVVTVLFVDMVGSTARAEKLDPEDQRALLDRYYARVRVEIERFGGMSRSSSATRSWPSSARPSRSATTRSERCAPRSRSATRSTTSTTPTRSSTSRSGSRSTRARRSRRSEPGRSSASRWSPATSSTPPPGCRCTHR